MEKNEYEIQHFKFSAMQVSLERQHLLQKLVNSAVDSIVDEIVHLTKSPETSSLLKQQRDSVNNQMMRSLEKPLKALMELDRKNFTIPPNVLLPSDFQMMKEYTASEEKQLDKELEELKQTFLENSIMIQALKSENEKYESLQTLIDEEVQVQAEVQKAFQPVDMEKLQRMVEETVKLSESI